MIGPLLFCNTIHPLLSSLQAHLTLGFLDDVTVGGPVKTVASDVAEIIRVGSKACESRKKYRSLQPTLGRPLVLSVPNFAGGPTVLHFPLSCCQGPSFTFGLYWHLAQESGDQHDHATASTPLVTFRRAIDRCRVLLLSTSNNDSPVAAASGNAPKPTHLHRVMAVECWEWQLLRSIKAASRRVLRCVATKSDSSLNSKMSSTDLH